MKKSYFLQCSLITMVTLLNYSFANKKFYNFRLSRFCDYFIVYLVTETSAVTYKLCPKLWNMKKMDEYAWPTSFCDNILKLTLEWIE